MSLNTKSNTNKHKYVSVAQDNFKLKRVNLHSAASTYDESDDNDSDIIYNPNITYYQNEDIDYRIKINEICLFSQHNQEEWSAHKKNFKLVQTLLFLLGLLLTLASLALSIWLLFFSHYNFLLHVLYKYELLDYYLSLFYYLLLIYFMLEVNSLCVDLVKLIHTCRLYQLLNLSSYYPNKKLLNHELKSEKINLDKKLVDSVQHLRERVNFRIVFSSIRRILFVLDFLLNLYYFFFVVCVKVFLSVYALYFMNQLLNSIRSEESNSGGFNAITVSKDNWNLNDRVYDAFKCDHFRNLNVSSSPYSIDGKY
jgi:hypothetical protein